ncbi:hypothetical protein PN498_04390 [Oscillatoria sp. CS-180]|uniref:hypothetical protein n=1 Tax=Oscillatoria sp. CS-180 TaxID=3021720 RepID=UPI002330AD01|nr:hypothetical protein [Oscillatoria sp. CS-180]MDB9525215.1 hypothetical protein [Oscillatoria sp. CS-180]
MLEPDHLRMLANGLANRFQTNVSREKVLALKAKVETWVIKENLEDRLIPYRNFEPLMWLLIAELRKQGKAYEAKKPYVGWINEYASTGKRSATPLSSKSVPPSSTGKPFQTQAECIRKKSYLPVPATSNTSTIHPAKPLPVAPESANWPSS